MLPSFALLAACGGEAVGPEGFSKAFNQASCEMEVRCGLQPSVAACLQAYAPGNELPQLAIGARAGRTVYDDAAAQRCIDGFAGVTCSLHVLGSKLDACSEVFTPQVPGGSTCYADGECLSSSCERPCGFAECCAGMCAGPARVGADQSCGGLTQCTSGLYCDMATSTCKARLGEGAACMPLASGCSFGLVCQSSSDDMPGLCAPRPGPGEACTALCDSFTDACSPTTQICAPRRQAGESCSENAAGTGSDCVPYARCLNGMCVALAQVGEACAANDCQRGTECGSGGTCVALASPPICP